MVSPHSGFLKRTIREETDQGQSEVWINVLEQLIVIVKRIQSGHRSSLMKGNTLRNADQVRKTGRENLKFLAKKPQYLKKDLRSGFIRVDTDYYRPVLVIDTKSKNNYDSPENRFLRGILIKIRQRLCQLKGSHRQQGRAWEDPNFRKRLNNLEGQLGNCLSADCMTDAGKMRQLSVNQIMQMPPSHQDIYRCYLILMKCSYLLY